MAEETISYDIDGGGWSSFWSFIPECMIGLNSSLYTFKNGNLYKHNTNSVRGRFYDVDYPSTITTVFNQEPDSNKVFKTIGLEGNSVWEADITTDLSNGVIETDYYKEKEGDQFAYIRRDPGTIDTKSISTQGIGLVDTFSALVATFGFTISASISVGDVGYIVSGSTLLVIGNIDSYTGNTITFDGAANTPLPGDFIAIVKDSTAESFGARGYYMSVKLTNTNTDQVELFSISTEAFKSYP